MITNLKHDCLIAAEQFLIGQEGAEQDFALAGECLAELIQQGQTSRTKGLVQTASLLLNLCDSDFQKDYGETVFAKDEVSRFVRRHLPSIQSILDGKQDSNRCFEKIKAEAEGQWGDFVAWFDSNDNSEPLREEVSESAELCETQIAMMLAAIEPSEQPSTTQTSSESSLTGTDSRTRQDIIETDSPKLGTFSATSDSKNALDLLNDQEFLEAYLDDAYRCLESMEQSVLALENSVGDSQSLQQFCRELHTLKGASASVGLSELAAYLHEVETAAELSSTDDNDDEIRIDSLLQAVDAVRDQISSLVTARQVSPGVVEAETFQTCGSGKRTADLTNFQSANETSIRIRTSKLDRLMDMLAELVVLRNRRENTVDEMNQLNQELSRCAARLRFVEDHPGPRNDDEEEFPTAYSGSNTLAEVAKDITEVARDLRDLQKPVSVDNQAISQFIRHFRQELMQLRRLPISGLFNRLQRAAREAANFEEKKVVVKVIGEDNGLEQEIQERLYEPLLHLIRNAVSHGIESGERRKAVGKSLVGSITLEAKSSSNLLVIEVSDDGGGIDFEAVRRRAIDRGLLSSGHHSNKHELSQLIFHPGFSTRDGSTEISGRGFGMDIVAATVSQMHGRVEVDSTTGQGSTMRLLIPLRSGIEHVMVVRAGGQLFALPTQSVSAARNSASIQRNFLQVSLSNLRSLPENGTRLDDNVLILRQTIGLRKANQFNVQEQGQTDREKNRFALTIDEVVGPEEVVVRSLPGLVQPHPLFCGVTLSGAGEMVLLLNAERLGEVCLQANADSEQAGESDPGHVGSDNQPLALVVDDSLSARKYLVKKLSQYGYSITEAGDGLEALEQLRQKEFAIVLTDLDMPRLGGLELLTDIQTGHYGSPLVVVVSSRNEEEFRNRALDAGAAAFLTKPVTDNSLANLLANLDLNLTHAF